MSFTSIFYNQCRKYKTYITLFFSQFGQICCEKYLKRFNNIFFQTTSANCIAVGEKYIFVGCAEGIIRCFDPSTLRFITTLPRNHYLGVDVSLGTNIQ